jgi:hypothetical protein
MLFNDFGFDRSSIRLEGLREKLQKEDPAKAAEMANKPLLCSYQTLEDQDIISYEKEREAEYYMNLLMNQMKYSDDGTGIPLESAYGMIDDHSQYQGEPDQVQDFIEKSIEDLTAEGKEEFKDKILEKINAGNAPGNISTILNKKKRIPKRKWETVIENWVIKSMCRKYTDSWIYDDPRYNELNKTNNTTLPSYVWRPDDKRNKIDVLLFQDTSGSCKSLAKRFFAAAGTIPPDRFNVKMCCFDTKVYPTSLKSGKLYGFGGTSFYVLEEYIQAQIANKKMKRYPSAIFVITDGYGDEIVPKYPKRWHWFLNTNYTNCIHPLCNIYDLSKFE